MPTQTTFPQHPRRDGDWWTVWQMLLYLANQVHDVFVAKFQQGTATIGAGNTSVAVTGLTVVGAYQVAVNPTGNPGGAFWVSGKTSSGFTINTAVAAGGGGIPFDWTVKSV